MRTKMLIKYQDSVLMYQLHLSLSQLSSGGSEVSLTPKSSVIGRTCIPRGPLTGPLMDGAFQRSSYFFGSPTWAQSSEEKRSLQWGTRRHNRWNVFPSPGNNFIREALVMKTPSGSSTVTSQKHLWMTVLSRKSETR